MLTVQEKLNELLDADGGISKRKVSALAFSIFTFRYLTLFRLLSENTSWQNILAQGAARLAILPPCKHTCT